MSSRNKPFRFPVSILIGSKPGNILKVLKGHKIDPKYYLKFTLTFILVLVFSILNLIEKIFYKKKLDSVQLTHPPVFIIGFWRSGTTLLHSLLCQDRSAAFVTTFHGVFPNLVLSQQSWLKPLTNFLLPSKRPFDGYSMDMDFPQEEDFGLMNLQPKSIYKLFYFPKDYDDIVQSDLHIDNFDESALKIWKYKYSSMVKKALINTKGERFISKNPCNIFRVNTLLEMYPDAKFIYIYRNPYNVVESFYRFVHEILPGSELQHRETDIPRERFAKLYREAMDEYRSVRDTIISENLMEIKYEDFKGNPQKYLKEIYEKFQIPGFDQTWPLMQAYLGKNSPDVRKHYEIEPEAYDLVNKFASDILLDLGYEKKETHSRSN